MSSCCDDHNTNKSEMTSCTHQTEEKEPGSFFQRFFYRIGKTDSEKSEKNEKPKGGCCG